MFLDNTPSPSLVRLTQPWADSIGLPALPLHLHQIIAMTAFYDILYTFLVPLISSILAPSTFSKLSGTKKQTWMLVGVSTVQSSIATILTIAMLISGPAMTWQERMWGYHAETASGLSIATGYFVWHTGQSAVQYRTRGKFMLLHSLCVMATVSLGYRPLALYYTPAFLSIEITNVFLNFQRLLDMNGMKASQLRAINHKILIVSWPFVRIILVAFNLYSMGSDLIRAVRKPSPRMSSEWILKSTNLDGPDATGAYAMPPVRAWMAAVHIGSFVVLTWQGIVWTLKLWKWGEFTPQGEAVTSTGVVTASSAGPATKEKESRKSWTQKAQIEGTPCTNGSAVLR